MTRKSYPTDLTDAQWQAIEPHFNQLRHYKWDKRKLVNAVLYINAILNTQLTQPIE